MWWERELGGGRGGVKSEVETGHDGVIFKNYGKC